jgi:hypothetical protein
MKILLLIIVAIISAVLYRMGGYGKPFNTKFRDFGCPLCFIGASLLWWHPIDLQGWLIYIPVFGLMFACMCTYWDKIFRYDNFWFTCFMYGIATFPLYWAGLHWYSILIYAVANAVIGGGISVATKIDWLEEGARGASLIILTPLLLI